MSKITKSGQGHHGGPRSEPKPHQKPSHPAARDSAREQRADDSHWLYGINAIEGQLQSDASRIVELWLEQSDSPRLQKLKQLAQDLGLRWQTVQAQKLGLVLGHDKHQGAAARYRAAEPLGESDLAELSDKAGSQALFLVLDGVTDPHNLGACIRSAAAAGATAVVIPKDKSAGLTPAVLRASAGTAARMPLVVVTNLARALELLKNAGVWCYGAAGDADLSLYALDLRGPIALVMGSEGDGLRRLTRERCDRLAYIPMPGQAESLNVSVAAGVMLFEAVRQRGPGALKSS